MYKVYINKERPRATFEYLDEAIHWLETRFKGNGLILDTNEKEMYPNNRKTPTFISYWDEKIDFNILRKEVFEYIEKLKQYDVFTPASKIALSGVNKNSVYYTKK